MSPEPAVGGARPGGRRGAAVLGSPILYSLSPALHRAAYAELGLTDWTYTAVDCREDGLAQTLTRLDSEGLAGVSLTMPLKRAVLPLLARTQRLAADVGAVNTVTFGGLAGQWWGANTDVPGMVMALRTAGVRLGLREVPWVLGAGATAASAIAALAELGARHVVVVARRPDVARELARVGERFGIELEIRPWSEVARALDAPLVVSTTPVPATDDLAAELASGSGGQGAGALFDVLYDPWPTPLARAWDDRGGQVVAGLDLLVAQAVEQVRLMTGRVPTAATMAAAGRAALAARAIG